jgi:hypothetical protein
MENIEQILTYSINIRHKHMPNANLTAYQKGAYYEEIKLFTTLPTGIKSLNYYIKVFKPTVKDDHSSNFFCSVDAYVNSCNNYTEM